MSTELKPDVTEYLEAHFEISNDVMEITSGYRLGDGRFTQADHSDSPTLKGFRVDSNPELNGNFYYLQGEDGGNIHEIDVQLLKHLASGGSIDFGGPAMASESDIVNSISADMTRWLPIALHLLASGGKSFFNSPKVAIKDIKRSKTNFAVTVGDTSYFTTSLTNDLFAKAIVHTGVSEQAAVNFNLSYPAIRNKNNNWELLDYADCHGVSNHTGSAVFAVTSDNYPIIQRQGLDAQHHTGKMHVSGAGSLELADLEYVRTREDGASFSDFVRYGMARELLEETGCVPQDAFSSRVKKQISSFATNNIHLLTIARDIQRGGLPIFLGFARIDRTLREILGQDSVETTVATDVDRQVVSGKSAWEFLNSYCRGKRSSNQLLLFRSLLSFSAVRDQFDRLYM